MATYLLGLFLLSFFGASYFAFKFTWLCFLFVTIQATFFHALPSKQSNLKMVE